MLLAHQVKFAQDMGYSAMFAASTFGFFGISMVIGPAQCIDFGQDWKRIDFGFGLCPRNWIGIYFDSD